VKPGERIPLHEHSGPNDGGPIATSTVRTEISTPGSTGGTGSITAADVPISDVADHYAATNVEDALAEVATAPGDVVAIVWVMDGGGSAISTGVKGDLLIPFACTITGWALLLDVSGDIVIDVWKDALANYPPAVGDSITAAAKPTVTAAAEADSTTLTGWTTVITAGDTLRFNVDSAATAQRATLILTATRT
jgi:hypothetical protein